MTDLNGCRITPEEAMAQIGLFSHIMEKMERPSGLDLDRLRLFLMEHGEEETKKLLEKAAGMDGLPFGIGASDYISLLSHMGTPPKNN